MGMLLLRLDNCSPNLAHPDCTLSARSAQSAGRRDALNRILKEYVQSRVLSHPLAGTLRWYIASTTSTRMPLTALTTLAPLPLYDLGLERIWYWVQYYVMYFQ